jgi:carbon-monoxide dehydrogenase medium subunit
VIPAPFDYEVAESVDHAIELLGRDEAKIIAGGHSLLPAMRLRFARPELLVDVGRLSDLRYVREDGDGIAIGALTRHADLIKDPVLAEHAEVLAKTATLIADPQVRHRGTIGGSLAHGDPASDLGTVLLALEADFVAKGPNGERTIPATEFFQGWFETALGQQDVLTEIRVPKGATGVYLKFKRRAIDWATVGVAAVRANGGTRVGLTSMGSTPLRARAVEEALAGGASPEEAAARAGEGASPGADPSGSAEYRLSLAQTLTRRALDALA